MLGKIKSYSIYLGVYLAKEVEDLLSVIISRFIFLMSHQFFIYLNKKILAKQVSFMFS
jgi:hypothetical protein